MFAGLHVFRRLQIVVPAHLPGLSLGRRKIFLSQTFLEVRVVKVVRSVKALARLWGAEMEGKAEPHSHFDFRKMFSLATFSRRTMIFAILSSFARHTEIS